MNCEVCSSLTCEKCGSLTCCQLLSILSSVTICGINTVSGVLILFPGAPNLLQLSLSRHSINNYTHPTISSYSRLPHGGSRVRSVEGENASGARVEGENASPVSSMRMRATLWSLFDWLAATSGWILASDWLPGSSNLSPRALIGREETRQQRGAGALFVPFKVVLQTSGQLCGWSWNYSEIYWDLLLLMPKTLEH